MASALEKIRKARQGSGTSLASANIGGSSGGLSSGSSKAENGGSALARLRAARTKQTQQTSSSTVKNPSVAGATAPLTQGSIGGNTEKKGGSKNRGGLLGGIGYVTEKATLGTVQGIEGIFDFLIGGAADLFGADKFAERQFANDWLNYNHADEWYNPGEGWKVAGDVGGGVGSSLPSIAAAAAITYFTGGAGAGIGAALVAGTSAAGTATKEAYQETGKLTGKEWGYGILTGATEAAVEKISGGLGAGAGAIGKKIGQAFGKTAAKEVGKTTVKTVAVDLGKNFLSEAFEEGFSELMAPQYKKITYDPNAKNATLGEIGYAALVGGLSGLVTSGAGTTVAQVGNIRKGAKAETSGSVGRIKAISEVVLEASGGKTDVQSVNAVRELYHDLTVGKLKITEGEKLTIPQKRALGELQTANMAAIFEPKMAQAAGNAVKNAEAIAERLNSYGNIKIDKNGKLVVTGTDASSAAEGLRNITAEDLRAGFDEKNGKQAIAKAMQDNEVLRYVAASDVAGRLIMSVEQFEKTALEGTNIKNQVDLNNFIEEASPEKRAALGRELGIADNEWDTLQLGRLNEAVRSYRESGKADAYKSRVEAVNKAKSIDESAAKKKIPSVIRLGDGKVERYKTDKVDIAVYREGDSFTVYDYNEGAPSRALSRAEVDSVLEQLKGSDSAADVAKTLKTAENAELTSINQENMQVSGEDSLNNSENSLSPSARMSKKAVGSVVENVQTETPVATNGATDKVAALREKIDAEKIDSYARENIADYDGLSTANQSMIRKVIREGRAHGLDDADVLSYARVAARSGVNIEFDATMQNAEFKMQNDGSSVAGGDVAGYYDPENNRIVVNPKAAKRQELILIHELDHALRAFRGNDGKVHYLVYKDADKKLSDETWSAIQAEYADQDIEVSREELLADEASAYYTEAILGGKGTVDLLLGKNGPSGTPVPTMKKILNFFTGAARAYSKDAKLSKEARAHYRRFKKMFDDFAKWNQGRNAETAGESEEVGESAIRRSMDERLNNDLVKKYSRLDLNKDISKMDGVPAIKLTDGSILPFTETHVSFIESNNIDVEDIENGGWISNGIYEATERSDTLRYKERMLAKKRLEEKRAKSVRMSTDYKASLKQLDEGTFDVKSNTHIEVSEHTPKIFIDKAGAADRKIIMSWDIALLAMKRREDADRMYRGISNEYDDALNEGNYHGLGVNTMNELPKALENPLYIVRQPNGRICAVTEMLYKSKRPIFAVIELEAYKTITQNGKSEENTYNLIVTVSNGQPRYFKNNVFNGEIVYNKNDEDPTHFISRLQSLKQLTSKNDLAGSSNPSISQNAKKSTGSAKKVSENSDKISKSARKSGDFEAKLEEESGTQKPLLDVFDKHGRNIEAVRGMSETRFRAEILKRFKYSNADNVRTRDLINYHLGKGAIAMLDADPIEITAPEAVGDRTLKAAAGDLKIAGVYENVDIGAVSIAPSRMKGYATAKLSKGDAALLSSLGDILERGRVVAFSHPDGVLYEELQIVAPIKVGEKTVYAEATVRRNDAGGGAYVYSVSTSMDVKKSLYEIRKPAQSKRLADKLDASEGNTGAKSGGYVDPENAVQERKSEESAAENAVQATGSEEATPSVSKDLLLMLRKNRGRVRITTKDYAALTEAVGARAARSIKNRWGYKAGTNVGSEGTVSIYRFVKEVKSSGEIDGLSGMSTLEAFAEINRVYKENSRAAGAFATNEEIERLKKLNKDLNDDNRATLISQVDYIVKKLGELKDATFFNASQYNTGELKSSVLSLVNVEWRGKNSATAVRRLATSFSAWYNKENPMLGYVSDENPGLYDAGIKETLESLKDSTGEQLTNDELRDLIEVLSFAKGFAERFSRVYRDGKWVDAKPEAEKSIAAAKKAKELNSGYTAVKHAMFEYAKALSDPLLVVQMADKYNPDGFFTKSYLSLEQGEVNARVTEMETLSEFDAFFEKNKGYANKLMNEDTEYRGHKMRRTQLIDLYMSLKSTTAMPGLAFSGFEFTNKQGYSERVDGFIVDQSWKHLLWSSSDADRAAAWDVLKRSSAYQRGEIKKLLTEQDFEYIAVMERGYLKTKELKASTDEIKFGFARTKEGYYLPTVRANVAKNVQNLYTQVDLVNNISANKRTKQGVTSELYIGDSSEKFKGHVRAISNYAGLSVEIDNYNKVFNLDISDNPNKPISVKTETVNAWRTLGIVGKNGAKMTKAHAGNAYISDIIDTITGVPQVKGALSSAVGIVRSGYAQATLGLNLKSWFSQMQSWISASSEYEIADMLKGARLAFSPGIYEQMDSFCPLAKLRNHDNSAAKAQGLIDNVKGIGELAMKPTSVIDRFVCALDFGAAQIEVERTTGAKVGTKENLEAAGKRLTEVILRTQQNTLATSKNAAARSGSELAKSVVMFKSDAIKTTGRGISTLGEYFTLRSELRSMKHSGASAEDIAAQEKRVRGAGRRAFKANLANVMGAFYAVAIGQLASLLFYGKKDEEDERPLLAVAGDFVGNILGGLPIIGDIYSRFADGYEIKDNGYALINDVLDSIDSAFSLAAKGAEGNLTSQDSAKALRNVTFAFSSLFGIPTKNIYKTGKGLLRIASPDTLYKMERVVEVKNLASDFEEAVEAGDDDKAMMILGLLLEERLGTDGERTALDAGPYMNEILRMEKAGYNILPRTIGSTVTIAGEEVDMTPEEQTALRARYSEAIPSIEALVGSAGYAALSDEQKESAVRFIYDVYYDTGISELYGYERNLKRRLFSKVIAPEKLALANAVTAGLESDYEDGRGRAVSTEAWAKIRGTVSRVNYSTVQGSKRKKVIAAINKLPLTTAEKLLIIAYKGYTVKDGDIRGVSAERAKQMLSRYAKAQGLSKDEAKALEEYL